MRCFSIFIFFYFRLELPNDSESFDSLYISANVICNQVPITEVPITTSFSFEDHESFREIRWEYTLSLPVKIR